MVQDRGGAGGVRRTAEGRGRRAVALRGEPRARHDPRRPLVRWAHEVEARTPRGALARARRPTPAVVPGAPGPVRARQGRGAAPARRGLLPPHTARLQARQAGAGDVPPTPAHGGIALEPASSPAT